MKSTYVKATRIPKFIVAQSTTVKTWKQPKCPSKKDSIKKIWFRYSMKYYLAIKNNQITSFAKTVKYTLTTR